MPAQTTLTGNVYFPDGAKAQVKAAGEGSYSDLGAINSAISVTLNYEENQVVTANAGKLDKQIRNMTVDGSLTLINLNPTTIEKLGGGLFERVTTAGSSVTSIDNQVIASGAATELVPYNLSIVETGGAALRVASSLVIASVTGSTDGALTLGTGYSIIDLTDSPSGKAIVFTVDGVDLTTLAQTITIAYTSVTPVARTTMYAGKSTDILAGYALKFTHTDDNGKIRELEIYSVDTNSGGFQFNFKGANEDGVEEMPIDFTGKVDTSRTNGRQLMAWVIDEGAE